MDLIDKFVEHGIWPTKDMYEELEQWARAGSADMGNMPMQVDEHTPKESDDAAMVNVDEGTAM